MISRITATTLTFCLSATTVALADPIEGDWKTEVGTIAQVTSCGGAFCIGMKTGKHAGKRIGRLEAEGSGSYSGSVTDPANDKTYSGSAKVGISSMKLSGCVLGGLICKSQTWTRQ